MIKLLEKLKGIFSRNKEVRCRRCGRILKSAKAKELGIGTCCFQKVLEERYTRKLFTPKKSVAKK